MLQVACTRILRLLRQKGVIEDDTVNAHEALSDNEPALAELAVASTLGRAPAGPALRRKEPISLRSGGDLKHPKGLCSTRFIQTRPWKSRPGTMAPSST